MLYEVITPGSQDQVIIAEHPDIRYDPVLFRDDGIQFSHPEMNIIMPLKNPPQRKRDGAGLQACGRYLVK